jgi:hypothetical protein
VGSTPDQELGNVQKCISAGCSHVLVVSTQRRTLAAVRKLVEGALSDADRGRVQYLTPEELFSFLESLEVPTVQETTVRGYRVKLKYGASPKNDTKAKKQAITEVLLRAMKRLRPD